MSARDLYGPASNEECQVRAAFASVGIGAPDTDCDGLDDGEENDDDNDFIPDNGDNCPQVPNPDQANTDGVGQGDACDPDADNDGLLNEGDNCPLVANPGPAQHRRRRNGGACDDSDGDLVMDSEDNCRPAANGAQVDHDSDILGDACDVNDDGDLCGTSSTTPTSSTTTTSSTPTATASATRATTACGGQSQPGRQRRRQRRRRLRRDDDNDRVPDFDDVCPFAFDPEQVDVDRNGIGLRCDSDEAAMLSGDLGWRRWNPLPDRDARRHPGLPLRRRRVPGWRRALRGGPALHAAARWHREGRRAHRGRGGQRRRARRARRGRPDARLRDRAQLQGDLGTPQWGPDHLGTDGQPAVRAGRAGGRVGAGASSLADPWAPGPDEPAYFLQLRPLSASVVGQTVHLSVARALNGTADTDGDGVADNVDSCVAVPNADQADADGDGLGDACDNCRTAANGPALPLGGLATQADADADSTGDACDVPRYLAEGATSSFFDMRIALANLTDHAQHVTRPLPARRWHHRRRTRDGGARRARDRRSEDDARHGLVRVLDQRRVGRSRAGRSPDELGCTRIRRARRNGRSHALDHLVSRRRCHALRASSCSTCCRIPTPVAPRGSRSASCCRAASRPLVKVYDVPAHSRFNVWVNRIPELASTDVSAASHQHQRRAHHRRAGIYLDGGGRTFDAGHESAGVDRPIDRVVPCRGRNRTALRPVRARRESLDLAGARAGALPPARRLDDRQAVSRSGPEPLQHLGRLRRRAPGRHGGLDDRHLARRRADHRRTRDVVGAERAWYEAHNSPGPTSTATVWGMAEGEVGGPRGVETYILLANTSTPAANVRVTLFYEDGTTSQRRSPSARAVASTSPCARSSPMRATAGSVRASRACRPPLAPRALWWSARCTGRPAACSGPREATRWRPGCNRHGCGTHCSRRDEAETRRFPSRLPSREADSEGMIAMRIPRAPRRAPDS